MDETKLTVEIINAHVAKIAAAAHDDEKAHGLEDDLIRAVLCQLADEGNELAKATIKSFDLDFCRWCA
jgi:hypothetical protein